MATNLIIIVMTAFKGAVRDFLKSPHCAANCLQHVVSSGQGAIMYKSLATHRVLIMCNMSWYEGTVQLLSLTRVELNIYLSIILLAGTIN